jgi:hypothetical protein
MTDKLLFEFRMKCEFLSKEIKLLYNQISSSITVKEVKSRLTKMMKGVNNYQTKYRMIMESLSNGQIKPKKQYVDRMTEKNDKIIELYKIQQSQLDETSEKITKLDDDKHPQHLIDNLNNVIIDKDNEISKLNTTIENTNNLVNQMKNIIEEKDCSINLLNEKNRQLIDDNKLVVDKKEVVEKEIEKRICSIC